METEKQHAYNEDEEVEKVYNFDRLLQLTTWAKVVAWVLIGTGVILVGLVVYILVTGIIGQGMPDAYNLMIFLGLFALGLLPIFLGVILHFFSEGAFLLVDIEQNTSSKPKP